MTRRPPASGSHHARGAPLSLTPDATASKHARSERAARDGTSAVPGALDQRPADDRHRDRDGRSPTRRARSRSRRPVRRPTPRPIALGSVYQRSGTRRLLLPLSAYINADPRASDHVLIRPDRPQSLRFRAIPSICSIASHARGRWFEEPQTGRGRGGCPIRALDEARARKPGSGSLATGQAPGPIAKRAALRAESALPRRRRSGRTGCRCTARRSPATTRGGRRRSRAATRVRPGWRR